jgi:C2 domain
MLKRLLLKQEKCLVRVYIIDAFNLSSRDVGDDSDPYLIVQLGNKVYNEREHYQLDEPNPKFHKMYDFEATFPGCPPLVVNVMDYDEIFGDDTVGVTSIDLEDRYFSPEWQSIENKPVEHRSLYHPSSRMSQGTLRCWVEIHPLTLLDKGIKVWDIQPKPIENFEVRVCVFNTLDVPSMDVEGVSDVYVRAFFDSKEEVKETDTHYRCGTGKASFNYRLLYNLKHPSKDYTYTI